MIYAYYRVSTNEQDYKNQKLGVLNFCKNKNLKIDKEYVDDGISGTVDFHKRQLGKLIKNVKSGDIIVCSEISRLGRKILDIMEILKILMEKQVKLYTIKENYELGDNIQSKVLAFAFGLSAEIERQLISQRTKEALARKKEEGVKLGRKQGTKIAKKLDSKVDQLKDLLNDKNKSIEDIANELQISKMTIYNYLKENNIDYEKKKTKSREAMKTIDIKQMILDRKEEINDLLKTKTRKVVYNLMFYKHCSYDLFIKCLKVA